MPFNLFPKQKKAIEACTGRINILEGSVRSGKTHGSYEWWARYLLFSAPKGDLLMTGRTLKSLERNVLLPMQGLIPLTYSLHSKRADILGRRIHLEGANDRQSESKIRGMTIAGHYGDEITLWPESYFAQSLARMSVAGAKMIGTTNPDSPNHWLKKDWIDADKGVVSRKLTIEDNEHLPADFVESLKREYTGLWYKRFIEGLWVSAEGSVYDMFTDDKIVKKVPKCFRYWLSGDYGTATTTVFHMFGQDHEGRIYLIKEYTWDAKKKGRQKTDTEYMKDLKAFIGGVKYEGFYCDPSAVSFMLTCSRNGIKTRDANNDVVEGIRNVSALFSNNLLYIHERCTETIDGLYGYVWDDKHQRQGVDKPLKQADHHADSLRYGIRSTYSFWKSLINKIAA